MGVLEFGVYFSFFSLFLALVRALVSSKLWTAPVAEKDGCEITGMAIWMQVEMLFIYLSPGKKYRYGTLTGIMGVP